MAGNHLHNNPPTHHLMSLPVIPFNHAEGEGASPQPKKTGIKKVFQQIFQEKVSGAYHSRAGHTQHHYATPWAGVRRQWETKSLAGWAPAFASLTDTPPPCWALG